LQLHWNTSRACPQEIVRLRSAETTHYQSPTDFLESLFSTNDSNELSLDDSDIVVDKEFDFSISMMQDAYSFSCRKHLMASHPMFKPGVELMRILNQCNCPIYVFDEIMRWSIKCNMEYQVQFNDSNMITRSKLIDHCMFQYDLIGLRKQVKEVQLPGSKMNVSIVCHDFKQCLYSILNDESLVKPSNLLFDINNPFQIPDQRHMVIGDINTGSVYRKAFSYYVNEPNGVLLCPIIFFIDKTFTDTHGRLNLEQIRFTLGIFNREARNCPNAWRTLGYVTDQSRLRTEHVQQKIQDYHFMTSVILESFKEAQKSAIAWNF
jgi:hypothetical protein